MTKFQPPLPGRTPLVRGFALRAQMVSRQAAWVVTGIAAMVLVGWIFGVPWLTGEGMGLAPMQPLTALGCLAAATSLLLLQDDVVMPPWRRLVGRAVAVAVLALAAAVLVRDVFGWQWLHGIDTYLGKAPGELTFDPVLIMSSIMGLMVAGAILAADFGAMALASILASIVIFGSLIRLLGYLYGDLALYGGNTATPVSLPTAICFLLLGVAALLLRINRGGVKLLFAQDSAGLLLRRMQGATLAIPIAMGWLMVAGQKAGYYPAETGLAVLLVGIIAVFSVLLWLVANTVHRLDQKSRNAEQAVARERQLLELVMQQLPVGVALLSGPPYKEELVNETAHHLLGSGGAAVWDPARLQRPDGKPYPMTELPLSIALATGQTVTKNDLVYRRPDGQEVALRVTATPLHRDKAQATDGLLILEDYSKELEVERAKDEFLSLATHQLQTPLAGVRGFLAMLRQGLAGPLNKEQLELANEAYDGNERELHIVSDLLNVARAESGRMVLKKEPTELASMLQAIVREQDAVIKARRQTATVHLPPAPRLAIIDTARLRMCLENLVSNASKYTKPGGVIQVRLEQTKAKTRIVIADSGVGIAKKDQAKLFKRFSRIENELSQAVGGTGLGLYLVKQIVDLHDGRIVVTSAPGKGATFTIELPA